MTAGGGAPGSVHDGGAEAVARLVLRERQSRDRGWYDDMAECYAAGATIEMSWFSGPATEFIEDTRQRSTGGVWGRHRLSPPTVRVHADRAWAELPLGIEFRVDVDGVEADLVSYCRSQYRARSEADRWRITHVVSIYERDQLTAAVPGQHLPLDAADFERYRPSYRCLAWYFERSGTPLGGDLPGDDQPDGAECVYDALRGWLRGNDDP